MNAAWPATPSTPRLIRPTSSARSVLAARPNRRWLADTDQVSANQTNRRQPASGETNNDQVAARPTLDALPDEEPMRPEVEKRRGGGREGVLEGDAVARGYI